MTSSMKIWLDNKREAPKGWARCYWPEEAITLLKATNVTEISLDHDLGHSRKDGYKVLLWMEEQAATRRDFKPPQIHFHTSNSSARQRMEQARDGIYKLATKARQ